MLKLIRSLRTIITENFLFGNLYSYDIEAGKIHIGRRKNIQISYFINEIYYGI